jgi:hypothetical protein
LPTKRAFVRLTSYKPFLINSSLWREGCPGQKNVPVENDGKPQMDPNQKPQ